MTNNNSDRLKRKTKAEGRKQKASMTEIYKEWSGKGDIE